MANSIFTLTFPAVPQGGGGVTDHGALSGLADDDHPQYQKESEKGAVDGYAGLDGSGLVPSAQLPSGSGSGDMEAATYDPTGISNDAFNAGNFIGNFDCGIFI